MEQIIPPVSADTAWEIESFLLKIFEYGDYSFRSMLRGEYALTLGSCCFAALHQEKIVGVVVCLYPRQNPLAALLGPVAVAKDIRRNKIASLLIRRAIDHLLERGCLAAYLGVSYDNPARKLYRRCGFEDYHGIVMRRLFCPVREFDDRCYNQKSDLKVGCVNWGDFCGVQALLASPCSMYCFDFSAGLFSSKYDQPHLFLPVFPRIMRNIAAQKAAARVLRAGPDQNPVGIAHLLKSETPLQQHRAVLDFFMHDNFLDNAKILLQQTLQERPFPRVHKINVFIPAGDGLKRRALEDISARLVAVLPRELLLEKRYMDVCVYEIDLQ